MGAPCWICSELSEGCNTDRFGARTFKLTRCRLQLREALVDVRSEFVDYQGRVRATISVHIREI